MKILVTGAKGFVGKNLCMQLRNIRDGKDNSYKDVIVDEVFEYDIDSEITDLELWCREADFVFNLAGVNRPKSPEEFMEGNFSFANTLLKKLKKYNNTCPVMISSSIQATLSGRYYSSEYGKSKRAGEELFFQYGRETGSNVLVYRFPNVYGKWCRPNYNSVIATFCYNIANGFPIVVNDPDVELELLYIDDLVHEMICALRGQEHRCEYDDDHPVFKQEGNYCAASLTHRVKLGRIVDLLYDFSDLSKTLIVPEIPTDSFERRLLSTFLSYLPKEKAIYDLQMKCDFRGSFTEIIRFINNGQVSINISKPGVTKGNHWHNSKWELFIVVSGHGLIQMKNECYHDSPVIEYEVFGDKLQCVVTLPGYTHNIINLSKTQDLVTVMYCNELFNQNYPDTFFDPINK